MNRKKNQIKIDLSFNAADKRLNGYLSGITINRNKLKHIHNSGNNGLQKFQVQKY